MTFNHKNHDPLKKNRKLKNMFQNTEICQGVTLRGKKCTLEGGYRGKVKAHVKFSPEGKEYGGYFCRFHHPEQNMLVAAYRRQWRKVIELLDTGIDVNFIGDIEFGYVKFGSDNYHSRATVLQYACCQGNMEMVKYLVETRGADVNPKMNDPSDTPLGCSAPYDEIAQYLLSKGATSTVRFDFLLYNPRILPILFPKEYAMADDKLVSFKEKTVRSITPEDNRKACFRDRYVPREDPRAPLRCHHCSGPPKKIIYGRKW